MIDFYFQRISAPKHLDLLIYLTLFYLISDSWPITP